jgi:hypothetical protein
MNPMNAVLGRRTVGGGRSRLRLGARDDHNLGLAHGFSGYNAALLGRASETLPAIGRTMRPDPTDRRHSLWFFFGGLAELLLGRVDAAVALLEKSLERNPSYGTAQRFPATLCLLERPDAAARLAASFRGQYPEYPANAFEQLWLSLAIANLSRPGPAPGRQNSQPQHHSLARHRRE